MKTPPSYSTSKPDEQDNYPLSIVHCPLSTAHFQHLAENTTMGLVSHDADGTLHYANPSARRLLDLTSPDQRDWIEAIHPEDRAPLLQTWEEALRTGKPFRIEYRLVRSNGVVIWLAEEAGAMPGEATILGTIHDISAEKYLQEAFRQSEIRYKALVDDQPDLICRFTPDLRLTYVNRVFAAYFDRQVEELIGASFLSLIPEKDHPTVTAHYAAMGVDRLVASMEYEVLLNDQERRWQEWTDRALIDAYGNVVGFQSIGRDITERKRTGEEIRLLAQALRNTHEAICIVNTDQIILFVNRAFIEIYGYEPQEVIGRPYAMFSSEDTVRMWPEQGTYWQGESWHSRKQGRLFPVALSTSRVNDEHGNPLAFITVATDITERKQLEKEILEISDREQHRIGQDIHDGLGQVIAGARFALAALEQQLLLKQLPEADMVAEINQMMREALYHARTLSHGLSPVNMEAGGLPEALQDLVHGFEHIYKVSCTLSCSPQVTIPNLDVATHLYRIVQEALNNALRHGKASALSVALTKEEDTAVLAIQDNGIGIQDEEKDREGIGLHIMKYRARMVQGTIKVASAKGQGTWVICRFPL